MLGGGGGEGGRLIAGRDPGGGDLKARSASARIVLGWWCMVGKLGEGRRLCRGLEGRGVAGFGLVVKG